MRGILLLIVCTVGTAHPMIKSRAKSLPLMFQLSNQANSSVIVAAILTGSYKPKRYYLLSGQKFIICSPDPNVTQFEYVLVYKPGKPKEEARHTFTDGLCVQLAIQERRQWLQITDRSL